MTQLTDQQRAANFMGALAHLLGGRPSRHDEFIDKVELILSGSEPHALQLLQFTERCRRYGRPVLWIHFAADEPFIPQIGLVAPIDGQTRIFENCMLWSGTDGGRARLVPDSFTFGAYRFDDELRLRHVAKAPGGSFEAAQPGMARAYRRLVNLQTSQLKNGHTFRLPELAKAA